jgi:hypothetical protein
MKLLDVVKSLSKDDLPIKKLKDTLEVKGFQFIARGCYKLVYQHPNWKDFVVKVYDEPPQNDCGKPLPLPLERYWMKPVFQTNRVMVQPFANGEGGTGMEAMRFFKPILAMIEEALNDTWHYDLHAGNCKFHNGIPRIIDYLSPRKYT